MLTLLKINNLALVESLEWQLGAGLVGVTGETGAGKSVIVGALKLVLGARADKGLIRTGETQCVVEAVFQLADATRVNAILEDAGIGLCEENELIVRRVVSGTANRQFVNNCAATLGVLKQVGENLVDLHGPHDHQSLLSPERQLAMLDAYAGAGVEFRKYRSCWQKYREAQTAYEEAREQREVSEQERELLRYQVEEIEGAGISPGEEEELEERYRRTSNATRLSELTGRALEAVPQLEELQRSMAELARIDSGLEELAQEVSGAAIQLDEVKSGLGEYLSGLELDPSEIHEVEERFNLVEGLKRKYGPSLQDALEHAAEARRKLESSENREGFLSGLRDKVEKAAADLRAAGRKLSTKRKRKGPPLAKEIRKHLVDLGFKQAEFEVEIDALSEAGPQGLERVDYLFGPNPGEPLKPLRQVASSGEISRVMLAIKNALADQDQTPLMVFDEIDANVGGEIARAVGQKMASLGESHQVVSITHFPQVAAVAHQHFVVEKMVMGGRTLSVMTEVTGEKRVDELVRMLGGGENEEARRMAQSLL